jgi:hypothetical protein
VMRLRLRRADAPGGPPAAGAPAAPAAKQPAGG